MVSIRPFRENDRQAVVQLWKRVFPDPPPHNDPDRDITRKLGVQRDLFLVAEEGNGILGTAMAGFDGHRGWVYYVAVHPEHRRRGVGAALMSSVERRMAASGCPKVNLQVRSSNLRAVSFYRHLGYETEERISMSKRLAPESNALEREDPAAHDTVREGTRGPEIDREAETPAR
mgnify:CR=1 FL=1